MKILSENTLDIYMIFLFSSEGKNEFDFFCSKESLLRYIRTKLGLTEWKQVVLPMLIKQVDRGDVVSVSYLSGSRRLFYKKIKTGTSASRYMNHILEEFIKEYYQNYFTKT